MARVVCWFSCGAASAVATKLVLDTAKPDWDIHIVYTRVAEEHPDNQRFLKDCEKWFGRKIEILENEKYHGSIVEVFDKAKYMGGILGAPCTQRLKKEVRKRYEKPNDINVFGFTVEEQERVDRWIDANADKRILPILIDNGLTHADCTAIISRTVIELPVMYKLGYKHNNCIGRVKGGAGYWNKIRVDFPEIFKARAEQERRIGAHICKQNGERIQLFDLDPNTGKYDNEPEIQCGIMCELSFSQMS